MDTARTLVNYLDRFVGGRVIAVPMDVARLFDGLSVGQQHHLNRALRAFFNYLQILGYDKKFLDGFRAAIPKDRIGIDIRVPEPEEILDSLRRISEAAPKYQALWHLCLDSGLRLVEAIGLITQFSADKLTKCNGFYRYVIGEFRGCKQAYYAYFTSYTYKLIINVKNTKLKRPQASHYFSKYRYTPPKYLRKFQNDIMTSEQLNIPEAVADFIQGRVPKTVGARHYMKLRRKADQFYPRYAEYVMELRCKAGLIN